MPAVVRRAWGGALLGAALLGIIGSSRELCAQDMEPRAYSATPIDMNFLIASYARTTGDVSTDPSLPIANVRASINTGALAYDRTFDLFGRTASAALIVPFFDAQVSGDVLEASRQVARRGLGDIRLRVTENLIGGPALSPAAFAERLPTTTLGLSFTLVAPTGDYDAQHLVNIGTHRWAFKPEIGLSQPLGDWFVDGSAGAWLFTDNGSFFGGHVRGEEPLWTIQAHGGYNFRPGLWLALDATHYFGGDTVLDGVNQRDSQSAWRYGATLSVPIDEGWSAKLALSTSLATRNTGKFQMITLALQYYWFDL